MTAGSLDAPARAGALGEVVLEARGIVKRYGGVQALQGADLTLRAGEIVALVGANGAGKSTLIKVISGFVGADDGTVAVGGEPLPSHSVKAAQAAGIAVVHQELNLVPTASVAENILLWSLPSRGGMVRERAMRRRAAEVLGELGVDIDPALPAGACTAVQQRLVMVATAMSQQARVLILDEPTACLPPEDAEHVLGVARRLRALGKTVVFVSHRLHEVASLADRAVVMRDGRVVRELPREELTVDAMVELLGGTASDALAGSHVAPEQRRVTLSARGLCGVRVRDVDVDVRAGEILGVAGLVGSGRSELLRLLAGVQPHTAGTLAFDGEPIRRVAERRHHIGYVGEDRSRHLFREFDVAGNVSLPSLRRFARSGLVHRGREVAAARGIVERVRLKGQPGSAVWSLSGGNRQKALLGRWLMSGARVLLLDEPTAGIDVGARAEIHQLLRELADRGGSVVVAIADPTELLQTCDRVIVLSEGHLTSEASRPFDEGAVLAASYARAGQSVARPD